MLNRFLVSCFILLSFFFLLPSPAGADVISDTLQGEELLFQRDYPAAIELFRRIEREYPESPSGAFGQMASWQTMMFENLDFRFKDEYEAAEKRFEKTAHRLMAENPSSWDLFMTGSGYGMRGFFYAREGKWFRALGSAVRAVQILKRAKFENAEFIDAELGIGMYNYWRSVLTKGLHFLPFFGDRRKEGISDVERVIRDGRYARQLAEVNMAFIYAREKEFNRARELLDEYLKRYPNNIILRQLSGDIYIDMKRYDKAAEEYALTLKIDPAMTKALYRLGRIYMRKGMNKEAKRYFEEFLATSPEKEWANSAKKMLLTLR